MLRSRQMARLTQELSRTSNLRRAAIDTMRDTTEAALAACAEMRGEMMRAYRARMHKFLSALSRDVAAHRRAVAHQVAQTRNFLGVQARNVASQRNATMSEMARIGDSRARAASRLRSALQHQVAELRGAAARAVAELSRAHRKMANKQKAELRSSRRRLRAATVKFIDAMHADRMKAHEVWRDFKGGTAA